MPNQITLFLGNRNNNKFKINALVVDKDFSYVSWTMYCKHISLIVSYISYFFPKLDTKLKSVLNYHTIAYSLGSLVEPAKTGIRLHR